jgi:hypothetical protein
MMTVADWRKRAHDCMEASRQAPSREGQIQWQALSEAWLKCAEQRDRVNSRRKALTVFEHVAATVVPIRASAVAHGEWLRARLALVEVSGSGDQL